MSEFKGGRAATLSLCGVRHGYREARGRLEVLAGADLTVAAGEMVGLVGSSGSGKSTLLHIAGLLERPEAGDIAVNGADCRRMSDAERTATRRASIGFVYQFHHLLPEFSALENIVLPQMIAGVRRSTARRRAEELLDEIGLGARASHRPSELSGGEQQRIAIVRALANRPVLLIADEPTGNLDPRTADSVFQMLLNLVRGSNVAALIATHNMHLAERMDKVAEMRDGRVVLS